MALPFLDVRAFMEAVDQLSLGDKSIPGLYRSLMEEEYNEFLEAVMNNDDVEQLDAICDLIWVTIGYAHAKGYDIHNAWNEVFRSNMSKLDPMTKKAIKNPETGKVVKPDTFSPPDLKPFVRKAI